MVLWLAYKDNLKKWFSCTTVYRMPTSHPRSHFETLYGSKSLPSISNARWNSRAIYALLCYILMPHYREKLRPICQYITGHWFTVWFGDHFFKMLDFSNIFQQLESFKKAKQCFQRQWSQEDTNILTQRSNICAEHSIKTAQDILLYTKRLKKLT